MACFNPYMFKVRKLKPSVEASITQEVLVLQILAKTPSPHPHDGKKSQGPSRHGAEQAEGCRVQPGAFTKDDKPA